ncbi:MAG: hypothetical protein K0S53_1876 [Bacteroidetes bacterium]|jgi:hypothetical protein|nr:hypothetical protein [Bacteroidota bacterium]
MELSFLLHLYLKIQVWKYQLKNPAMKTGNQ